jgi:ribose transport system permease protein
MKTTALTSITRRLPNIAVGWGVIFALLVEIVLISILSPFFLQANNIFNVLKSMSIIAIVGTGMTIAAALMGRMGFNPILSVLAGIGVGMAIGFVISLLVNRLKINSIIVTLAMLSIVRGFTYMISRGSNIFIKSAAVNFLGQGYIGIVPFPVILMIVFVALGTVFLRFTVIGRQIYAIGGNERAAKLAGIQVNKVRTIVFVATSALAAFSGLVMGGMLGSAEMTAGTGLEMDVIAAVIIGGASLKGGRGTIVGSLIGAAIMGILRNGFILLGFSYEAQIISIGVVIILAVTIDSLRTKS